MEENLIRPNDDKCKDVKGEIVLAFFVDKEGNPQNITVVHGICESADKEAIRACQRRSEVDVRKPSDKGYGTVLISYISS